MTTIAELDAEIVAAEKIRAQRESEIRHTTHGGFTGIDDEIAAAKRVKALRQRREDLMSGVAKSSASFLPPLPVRSTKRSPGEGEPAQKWDGPPKVAEAREKFHIEVQSTIPRLLEDVENHIEEHLAENPRENYAITITRAHYGALIGELVYVHALLSFVGKMTGLHGRRIDDLEGNQKSPRLIDEFSILRARVEKLETEVRHNAISGLEERIAELESRPVVKYAGVYSSSRSYRVGEMVTHRGGIWHCEKPTASAPGDGPSDWVLAVKSGRDGRDIR